MFGKLVETSCPLDELREKCEVGSSGLGTILKKISDNKSITVLQVPHLLSIDTVLSNAIEMGSYAYDCWKHVIRFVFCYYKFNLA